MSESKSFGKLKKILIGASMVGVTFGQFSSYAPAYLIDTPEQFNYGSYPFINPFDPYIGTKNSRNEAISPSYDQRQNTPSQTGSQLRKQSSRFPTTIIEKSFLSVNQDFQYGGTGEQNPTTALEIGGFSTKTCLAPRVNIAGICRCPNNGLFLSGICFPRATSPNDPQDPIDCYWPRKVIFGKCECPDRKIFFKGQCINPDNNNSQCRLPRTLIGGKCVCPNNDIYLSGRCYKRDGILYPTQPIGNVTNQDSIQGLSLIFRSYNGQDNNEVNKKWGSKDSPLERRGPALYKNGANRPIDYLPNPRELSNEYISLKGRKPQLSRNQVTMAFVIWGQFLDHDIDLTQAGKQQSMNIDVPDTDKFFDGNSQIKFKRSKFIKDDGFHPRQFPNQITSWIDGSQVYGSDETTARYLRSFSNGKMRVSEDNLLPKLPNGMFQAGDIRVNQNIILTSYHTIFIREHNRICDSLKNKNPAMNDQELYQAARHFVIGLLQKISIDEFLPIMMGIEFNSHFGPYTGYKPYLNPNIPIQFSTAGYRGHMLIIEQFPMLNRWGQILEVLKLRNMFFRPDLVTSDKISQIFRGLAQNIMKQKSPQLIDQLRNLLVLDPAERQIKLDLFCLNIQRGRDHGLPSYNEARKAYGLKKIKYFTQIVNDPFKAQILQRMYKGKIDDVELIVGVWSEKPVLGGVLGQLGCQIIGQAFRNLRDGDKFWYQHAYPPKVIEEIHNTQLSDIIRRNTDAREIQNDVFHYWRQDSYFH